MIGAIIELIYYITNEGKCPYLDWFCHLDLKSKTIVLKRLNRIRNCNFGDYRSLGNGLCEFRFDYGPAYRIYYTRINDQVVLLLIGGDKGTQTRDIKKARKNLENYYVKKVD